MTRDKMTIDKPSPFFHPDAQSKRLERGASRTEAKNKELVYKPGQGIDYIVHLEEDTYKLLQAYQEQIGAATKNGAIKRLLDNAIAEQEK